MNLCCNQQTDSDGHDAWSDKLIDRTFGCKSKDFKKNWNCNADCILIVQNETNGHLELNVQGSRIFYRIKPIFVEMNRKCVQIWPFDSCFYKLYWFFKYFE